MRILLFQGEVEEGSEEADDETGKSAVSLARKSLKIMLPFVVSNFVYPYSVVGTVMAVSGSGCVLLTVMIS